MPVSVGLLRQKAAHNGLIIEAWHDFFLTSMQLCQRNQRYIVHIQLFLYLSGDFFKRYLTKRKSINIKTLQPTTLNYANPHT